MISVIVPHYNQKNGLRLCLTALRVQDWPGHTQIIVADNMTPGGIFDIEAEFPEVTFVTAREKGAAHARNEALKLADGEIIAFTDSDCVPDPAWLSEMVRALENPDTDMVGGEVVVTIADPARPTGVESFEKVFGFRQRLYVTRKNFSVTANLAVRRPVLEQTGQFVHGVSEDLDWCQRAVALGFRLDFAARAVVNHPARRDFDELVRKWERLTAEHWQGNRERSGGMAGLMKWYLRTALVLVSIVPHSAVVMISPRLGSSGERLRALFVLGRIRVWRARQMLQLALTNEQRAISSDSMSCTEG